MNVHISNTEIEVREHMDIPNQEEQYGESFSAFFTKSFILEPIKLGKRPYVPIL